MSDFQQLLVATLGHLEDLRDRGVTTVPVSKEVLVALSGKAGRASVAARPGKSVLPPPSPAVRPQRPISPEPAGNPAPAPASSFSMPSKKSVAARWGVASGSDASKPVGPDIHRPLPSALPRAEKEAAVDRLRKRALACTLCPQLAKSRTQVVFGVGDIHAPLMFVGEAPGADEDLKGEPFVGAAGQLLTRIIQAMGLDRNSVYIANILKCRPDTPGQTSGNRKPTPNEMGTCIPYLHEQIDLIQPKAMVALGTTAVEGLLGASKIGITQMRGTWATFRGVPLMPTYHPAYLLRNQTLELKREVWEDMMAVMEMLGMPISDKQRGYFLNVEK